MQSVPAVIQVGAGFRYAPEDSLLLGTADSFTMYFGTTHAGRGIPGGQGSGDVCTVTTI